MATTIRVLNLNTGNEEDLVIKSPEELSEATKAALDPTEILTIGTVTAGATPSASFTGRKLHLVLPLGPKGEDGADGTMSFEDLTQEQKDSLKGDPGEQGAIGPRPAHEWDGTILKVQNPDGSMDAGVDLAIPSTTVVIAGQTYNWTLTEGRSRNGIMTTGSGDITLNGKTFALDSATTNNIFALIYVGGKYVILTKDANYTKKNDGTTDIAPDVAPGVEPPIVVGNDVDNTLTATKAFGTEGGTLQVSENDGAYATYAGAISVGNVNRPAGYWKFRTLLSGDYSAVVSSPAFTASVFSHTPALHLDYEYGITESGGKVSAWVDDRGNVFTQTNEAEKPLITAAGVEFTGVEDLLATVGVPITNDNFTIMANLYFETTGITLLGQESFFLLYYNTENDFKVFVGGRNRFEGAATIETGTWFKIAITWDGTTPKLYKNGILLANLGVTTNTGSGSYNIINIGGGTGFKFNGKIKSIALFDVAMTAGDILTNNAEL